MSDREIDDLPSFDSPSAVCGKGDFPFAAAFLDHGHIDGQCKGLTDAGGELRYIFDGNPARSADLLKRFPSARVVDSFDRILGDREIRLVAAAAVPSERAAIGRRVMEAGKDYFTDKAPFTTLEQLETIRKVAAQTSRKYAVYFSERLHVESAVYAGELIRHGSIGRVIQVMGLGPHRIGKPENRPAWFFQRERYGGILCDIGSHQCEQFLHYAGASDGTVNFARAANFAHPDHPELEDFGEASFTMNNGVSCYFRVDWFTPSGLRTWGDGRTFILGTEGYIELRKYIDVTTENGPDQVILANSRGERRINVAGKVGFPFFGRLILDCLNRAETAMTQEHAFKAAELCLRAQAKADGSANGRNGFET